MKISLLAINFRGSGFKELSVFIDFTSWYFESLDFLVETVNCFFSTAITIKAWNLLFLLNAKFNWFMDFLSFLKNE